MVSRHHVFSWNVPLLVSLITISLWRHRASLFVTHLSNFSALSPMTVCIASPISQKFQILYLLACIFFLGVVFAVAVRARVVMYVCVLDLAAVCPVIAELARMRLARWKIPVCTVDIFVISVCVTAMFHSS